VRVAVKERPQAAHDFTHGLQEFGLQGVALGDAGQELVEGLWGIGHGEVRLS